MPIPKPNSKQRVIQTKLRNPNPKKNSDLNWLKTRCIKKANNFVNDQRAKVKQRKKREPKYTLEICSSYELADRIYYWCIFNATCVFCDKKFDCLEDITINHNRALAIGGNSQILNLSPAHERCNQLHGRKIHAKLLEK